MIDDEVVAFLTLRIRSVYTLELLLTMKQGGGAAWTIEGLISALRSSRAAVTEGLNRLVRAGLVSETSPGVYAFSPATPELDALAAKIEAAYSVSPLAVVRAIVSEPDDKLRAFSNAFKIKE